MDCKDESIAVLLPDYYFGGLAEPGRRKVEEHLSGCDVCRRSLKVMELLSNQIVRSTGNDPASSISTELLRRYFEDKSQLDASELQRISERLESDSYLRQELEFLRGLERDMTAAVASRMPDTEPVTHREPSRAFRFRRPVLAFPIAAAILGVMLVVLFGIVPRVQQRTPIDTGPLYALHGMMRSGQSIAVLSRTSLTTSIRLLLPRPLSTTDVDYHLRVCDASETQTFLTGLRPEFTQPDGIRVSLDPRSLPDGRYILVLTGIPKTTPADSSSHRFAFELKTAN